MITIGGHTIDETKLNDGAIIDAGCRDFTFSSYFKGRNVYAIDLDEDVFKMAPEGITTINAGISNIAGTTTYYKNGEATMMREVDPDPTHVHIDHKYAHTCKTITIEDLYLITGTNVDILKLDCEGAEYLILDESFKPIPKQISVEFHHHCVPALHMEKIEGILTRLKKDYEVHNMKWEKRHGCDFNFWDVLFIRKW